MTLATQTVDAFRSDGAVILRGLFADWVEVIRSGIARNMESPGLYASESVAEQEPGRFFDDYCNWERIPEFEDVVRNSPAGSIVADLMGSEDAQLFHEHVLVKEPGTAKRTPWHQDSPYYFVEGEQTVSLWIPVDPVKEGTLRCVAGSHRWPKPVLPTRWLSNDDFYPDDDVYMPVPDPDTEDMRILEWEMEPGDAVAFSYRTLHGSRGNHSKLRRRAFSLRFVGDDARYVTRPGITSPPFPGHNMTDHDRLRQDWFPIIYSRAEPRRSSGQIVLHESTHCRSGRSDASLRPNASSSRLEQLRSPASLWRRD